MPSLSPCLKLVGKMSDADADDLIARVDSYIEAGVAPAEAQRTATQDILAELEAERAEVVGLATPEPKPSVTDTPAFKKWFGASRVVDADGKPLVVYHATTYGDFAAFDRDEQRKGMAGFGFYFTDQTGANIYSDYGMAFQADRSYRGDEKRVNVMPVYLAMENPLVADNIADVFNRYGKRDPGAFGVGRGPAGMPAEAQTAIERDGFDGVIANEYVKRQRGGSYAVVEPGTKGAIKHPVYVAFRPEQIKSAIGNTGDFDGTNPDIRFSQPEPQAGPGFYSALRRELAAAKTNASPAEYWTNLIKGAINKGAVKRDEVTWSGVEAWLGEQDGKIKKDAVLEWLDANGVKVEEAVLGSQAKTLDAMKAALDGADFLGYDTRLQAMAALRSDFNRKADADKVLDQYSLTDEERVALKNWLEVNDLNEDRTKYGQYTLPGGTNYTERLLKLPGGESKSEAIARRDAAWAEIVALPDFPVGDHPMRQPRWAEENAPELYAKWQDASRVANGKSADSDVGVYRSSHWQGHPNVIGHIRMDDRVDADGKRVLFVGELQSDWGQQGKKQGFLGPKRAPQVDGDVIDMDAAMADTGKLPAAPFVDSTTKWVDLTLKRVIQLAVSGGYDKVAFITGEQAAGLYSLDKQVGSVTYVPGVNGGTLLATDKGDTNFVIKEVNVAPEKLPDFIGKELAQRLIDQPEKDGSKKLRGDGLKVPATGMRTFYDSVVPAATKALLKRLGGGQMGVVRMERGKPTRAPAEGTPFLNWMGQRHPEIRRVDAARAWSMGIDNNEYVQQFHDEIKTLDQPGFTITDSMRAAVSDGLPLFSQERPTWAGFDSQEKMMAARAASEAQNANIGKAWERVRAGWPAIRPDDSQTPLTLDRKTAPDPMKTFAGMSKEEYDRRRAQLSFAQVHGSTWDSPEKSKWDSVVYQLADKMVDLKRVTAAIREAGVTLTDRGNAYLREELFQSRAASRAKAFMQDEMLPLLTEMRAAGVTKAALGEYLHARHAEERNLEMQARNLNRPNNDALSGMSTADANRILAAAPPAMRRLAAHVDAMIAGTRNLMEISGIEDQATVDALRNSYQHYVPLHRDEAHPDGHIPIGSGYSVKGSVVKAATGSEKPVTHDLMLAHIMEMREAVISRSEKNLVSMAIYHMALTNPNPDWWAVDKPRMVDRLDERVNIFNPGLGKMVPNPNFGQVIRVVDPLYKSAANVLVLKVNGQDRTVVFNDRNERAIRMAEALKNLDTLQLQLLQKTAGAATRWLSAVNTKYNPVFTVVNALRDLQGAALNLTSTPINGQQLKVMNPAVLGKIAREIYRKERGLPPKDPTWAAVYEDFLKRGGQTGYRQMYDNIEDRGKKLQNAMDRIEGGGIKALGQTGLDVITAANDAVENMLRVSAYKVALDKGMSKDQAASLAKNLTVNFNRKGATGGQFMGSLYMFFNAAVQGNARLATTVLTGKTGKMIAAGGITMGVLQALLTALVLDDEEEEAIPDYVKRTSWLIPYRDKDDKAQYIAIPMPLGLHILPNIGRMLTEAGIAAGKGEPINPTGRALELASTIFDAASPMGGAESAMQLLAPSVVDPIVQLSENKTGLGSPVYRDRGERDAGAPGYTLGRESTNPVYKGIAYGIHMAMNEGNPYERNPDRGGWASPQPEAIRLIPETILGGVWRESEKIIDTAAALASSKDIDRNRVILLSRFSGDLANDKAPMTAYYRNLDAVEAANYGRKRAEKDGKEYDNPLAELASRAGAVRRQMRDLIDARREMALEDGAEDQIKEIEAEMAALMREFNDEVREARRGD